MTKDQVIQFRNIANKNLPIKIICDNEHTFYDNCKGYFPIIWDDENEQFTVLSNQYDNYSALKYPLLLKTSSYDHIQYIEVSLSRKDITDKLLTSLINDADILKEYKDMLSDAGTAYTRTIKPASQYPDRNPAHDTVM